MALTYEQFKKAKESGLSTEQIVEFEKRRTKESQVGQKIQTQTEQPSGILSNVLGATKAVGGFLGGLAKDMTKSVASNIVSPIQLAKTAKNYYGDEDVQKRASEAMRGIDPDKQAKHTDDLYKALKTAETEEEKASIIKLMQEDLNKYVKEVEEKPIKEEVDTSVTLPFYGEIEAPKTAKEVAGRALETAALGAGGTAKVGAIAGKSLFKRALTGPGSKIGAAYGAGSALSENKSLGETAIQAGIGGILGGATDLALIGGGKGLQKLGEKIQKPTTETKLSLGEKAASSIINSLIKPLKKDFAYGKNPGLSVAREKITANSWDDLVTKIGKAKTKTGKEIGSFYKDNVDGKTTVNLSNSLKSINETIKKAASENNQSVINRLEDVKNAITKKLVPAKDEAGKTIIKTAGKKRLYNIKPSNAQSIIEKIGGMTKFTGNVSDDNMVNKALKKVYGSARNELESSIKKVDESLYSKIRQLNEHYGNITSADIAAKNREMIVQRANLMGLAPEVISGTSIVGGLASGNPIAIIGGIMTAMGNQAMKSPAIKTRLASILAGASNKERVSIFAKYPALKSLKENIGVGTTKAGELLEKIPGIAEEAPRKSVQSLMDATRTKMPIGMTIKDVSKQGFKEAGVPEKLIQEARKYKSAEEFVKAQGTPVYHSSSEKFANGKPNFDAYFGDADWKKAFAKEFGVNEYEVVLPKNKKILDLNKDTPEANAFIEKWGGSREDFYDEDWVNKYKVFPEVKKSGYDGAKFQGEYILSKDLINETKTKSELEEIWKQANQATPVYRGQDSAKFSIEGKSAGIGKSFTTDKKIAEVYGSKGKIIDGFVDNKDVLRYNELDSKTKQYIKSIIDERIDRVKIGLENENIKPFEELVLELGEIARIKNKKAIDISSFGIPSESEIRILSEDALKTKSQLKDIWNKENQKDQLKHLE